MLETSSAESASPPPYSSRKRQTRWRTQIRLDSKLSECVQVRERRHRADLILLASHNTHTHTHCWLPNWSAQSNQYHHQLFRLETALQRKPSCSSLLLLSASLFQPERRLRVKIPKDRQVLFAQIYCSVIGWFTPAPFTLHDDSICHKRCI